MTRVRIDSPGITIDLDADEPMDAVTTKALEVFHAAGGWPQTGVGPAFGFAAELRHTPPAQPSGMPCAPGPYPTQATDSDRRNP